MDARALELARVLTDVAALVEPPSGGVELPEDLTYRSWPSENPFDRGDGSLRNHVLGMESLGEAPGGSGVAEPVDRVTWDPEHPLDGVLAVLHGALGEQGSYSPTERSRVNVGSAGPVPPTVQRTGLLARTRAGQFRRNAAAFRGVVCVDPESVGDLVGFWNLRAAGADVVLYPVGQQTLARDYLHAWFQDLADPTEELMLWATSAQIAERATADLAGWFPGRLVPQRLSAVPEWVYVLPVDTRYSHSFDIGLDIDDWSVRLPVPKLAFLPPASWYERFGTVSADVRISSASRLKAGRGFSVPRRRELGAGVLRSRTSPGLNPFLLAHEDGFTVGVDAREDHVVAPLLGTMEVLQAIFGAVGGQLSRSDAGLYVERVMDMLGGVSQDGIALQPAVRAVLHRASTAPYGRPVQSLVAEAKRRAGEWPESLFGRGRNYPAWAVQWLCDRGMLQARLKSTCPSCGNTLSVAPADLADSVACPLCLASRPLALHLTALRPEWRLALNKNIQPERIFETMPVLAALSLLAGARGYSGDDIHNAVGVRLRHADVDCEIDLVVASRERQHPLLIIGECKSYRDSITPTDIANLARVQNLLLDRGIERYLLFATMRDRFGDDEIAALRQLSQTVPSTGSFRPRAPLEALAPLLFDGRSMSTHSFSQQSLLRARQGPHSLASLAAASCNRVLGLDTYTLQQHGEEERFEATWGP